MKTSDEIGIVASGEVGEPPAPFEGQNYSYSDTHFFKTSGGRVAETMRLENDDEFGFPRRFDVVLNTHDI